MEKNFKACREGTMRCKKCSETYKIPKLTSLCNSDGEFLRTNSGETERPVSYISAPGFKEKSQFMLYGL